MAASVTEMQGVQVYGGEEEPELRCEHMDLARTPTWPGRILKQLDRGVFYVML